MSCTYMYNHQNACCAHIVYTHAVKLCLSVVGDDLPLIGHQPEIGAPISWHWLPQSDRKAGAGQKNWVLDKPDIFLFELMDLSLHKCNLATAIAASRSRESAGWLAMFNWATP